MPVATSPPAFESFDFHDVPLGLLDAFDLAIEAGDQGRLLVQLLGGLLEHRVAAQIELPGDVVGMDYGARRFAAQGHNVRFQVAANLHLDVVGRRRLFWAAAENAPINTDAAESAALQMGLVIVGLPFTVY